MYDPNPLNEVLLRSPLLEHQAKLDYLNYSLRVIERKLAEVLERRDDIKDLLAEIELEREKSQKRLI